MVKKITNAHLWNMILDIENMQHTPALAFFLHDKIENFYKRNKGQINFLRNQVQAIANKYVEKDEKGNLKIITGENGQKAYAHESPELNDLHQKELDELMKRDYELKF
jgi:hypothetical protein